MTTPDVAEKAEEYCLKFMRGRAMFNSDQVKCVRESFLAGYAEAEKEMAQLKQQLVELTRLRDYWDKRFHETKEKLAERDARIVQLEKNWQEARTARWAFLEAERDKTCIQLKQRLEDAERVVLNIANCMTATPQLDCVDYFAKHAGEGKKP